MTSFVCADTSLNCEFKVSCGENEVPFLYANKNFHNIHGDILSSNVAISKDVNYDKALCCKSQYGDLKVNFINSTDNCDEGDELMFFTQDKNARVRFKEETESGTGFKTFDLSNYNYKSCVVKPEKFALFDIIASDRDYGMSGYTCMYKINNLENGLVSDCDATFDTSSKYKYTVWGRLWEDTSSLKCNSDCTSKLDGRVYSSCVTQIEECRNVPDVCNGALLNTWVPVYNSTGGLTDEEILCAPSWDSVKEKTFTNEAIEVKGIEGKCENVVSKNFPVILNNNKVNMRIYICED